jgi:hypothetical protein
MKRNFRLLTLADALVAAVWLTSLAPVAQREANAGPLYRAFNGGYYYSGGYAPDYGGYSGYGYGPYGYDTARGYVYPSYRSYQLGNGFETDATYNGIIDHNQGGSRFYGQPYRPAYNPYGYGGYGPYGY